MDILEVQGIIIPNSVLIKHMYVIYDDTDDELVAILSQYSKPSNIHVITDPGVFQDTIIVEFDSGYALGELRKILLHTYICQTEKVIYDILELSTVCFDFYGKLKMQRYLGELKELAKRTGQDYAEVLRGVMALLGQSITEPSPNPKVKISPDDHEEVMLSASRTAIRAQPLSVQFTVL